MSVGVKCREHESYAGCSPGKSCSWCTIIWCYVNSLVINSICFSQQILPLQPTNLYYVLGFPILHGYQMIFSSSYKLWLSYKILCLAIAAKILRLCKCLNNHITIFIDWDISHLIKLQSHTRKEVTKAASKSYSDYWYCCEYSNILAYF